MTVAVSNDGPANAPGDPPEGEGGNRSGESARPAERLPALPVMLRQLLRSALVDGEDARFPWWLPLPGLVLAALWAAYGAVTAEGSAAGELLRGLAWPGGGILVLVTLATFLGWQLDID